MARGEETSLRTVVVASSSGTAFEWYDFFVYGTLASIISRNFFSELDETSGLLAALALFAAGFLFRPVGALLFGRLGDRFGRKGAFLATVVLMGAATFAIGLLPNFEQAGILAPILLIVLRILQGLAVGGEYGGAAIYVAEHAPAAKRGQATGWIQASAAFGLVGALCVVIITRGVLGEDEFSQWGWRIPFLLSAVLVAISIWMRLRLKESPEFVRMEREGELSRTPFADVFLKWNNLKYVLIAFVSLMGAQGAIWWCVFFYSQIFLETFMKLDPLIMNYILIVVTIVSIPLYVLFGALSDRVGRKPILALGMGLAVIAMFPAFQMLARGANPQLIEAQEQTPVVVYAASDSCSIQFDLLGRATYDSPCDMARNVLTRQGVPFTSLEGEPGAPATVQIGEVLLEPRDARGMGEDAVLEARAEITAELVSALTAAGYPQSADPSRMNWFLIGLAFAVLVVAATALYGPLAAAMVELFPTNIRYTALSVPYHVGVGWVGGFMPVTAFAISSATGNLYSGLWYAVFFAAFSLVCCLAFFPETRGRALEARESGNS